MLKIALCVSFVTFKHMMNGCAKILMISLSVIIAACHDIDQWTCPVPGDTLNLPIMGSVIQVYIISIFSCLSLFNSLLYCL